MECSKTKALARKKKRVLRIRKRITGTALRPRLCITKTNRQLFIQLIDDVEGRTLVSMSSLSKDLKKKPNVKTAKELGSMIAAKCAECGIKQAVLDRRGNKYHGQIASLADQVRESGIQI